MGRMGGAQRISGGAHRSIHHDLHILCPSDFFSLFQCSHHCLFTILVNVVSLLLLFLAKTTTNCSVDTMTFEATVGTVGDAIAGERGVDGVAACRCSASNVECTRVAEGFKVVEEAEGHEALQDG